MEVKDFSIVEQSLIRPIGQVSWKKDEQGNLAVTSISDGGPQWVGIRRSVQLDGGPYELSYQLKTVDTSQAHLKVEWYDEDENRISMISFQVGIDGTSDWKQYSGRLFRPPSAVKAEILFLMEPKRNSTMEVKDLSLGEQQWVHAIFGQDNDHGASNGEIINDTENKVLISGDIVRDLGLSDTTGPSAAQPVCTLEQASPWSVQVRVTTEGPAFVVLNQAFDAGWRAYEGAPGWLSILFGTGRSPARHFMANGYANGWYIDRPGEYVLTLYYWPQTLFYLGIMVSILTWAIFLTWYLLRRRKLRGRIWR